MIVENGDLGNQAADQRLVEFRDGGGWLLKEKEDFLSCTIDQRAYLEWGKSCNFNKHIEKINTPVATQIGRASCRERV